MRGTVIRRPSSEFRPLVGVLSLVGACVTAVLSGMFEATGLYGPDVRLDVWSAIEPFAGGACTSVAGVPDGASAEGLPSGSDGSGATRDAVTCRVRGVRIVDRSFGICDGVRRALLRSRRGYR